MERLDIYENIGFICIFPSIFANHWIINLTYLYHVILKIPSNIFHFHIDKCSDIYISI